jgi:hypothetical protein
VYVLTLTTCMGKFSRIQLLLSTYMIATQNLQRKFSHIIAPVMFSFVDFCLVFILEENIVFMRWRVVFSLKKDSL